MPAGDLRYRVGFYQRGGAATGSPPPPDYGMGGGYPTSATFITRANIEPRLGGESVQAARLAGKNFVNVTVRQSSETAQVDTDWICKNEDSGEVFNIRSIIDPFGGVAKRGFYFEMLCEKGVAT
jgi:head-tail joining protein